MVTGISNLEWGQGWQPGSEGARAHGWQVSWLLEGSPSLFTVGMPLLELTLVFTRYSDSVEMFRDCQEVN